MDRRLLQSGLLVSAAVFCGTSPFAHHSLASFDVSAPLWVKGTVVRFERVNPHSVIFLDEKTASGQLRRWAVDGPSTAQLERQGLGQDFLKPGVALEICGFATKELPDGKKRVWSDYGQLSKCISPEEQSSLIR